MEGEQFACRDPSKDVHSWLSSKQVRDESGTSQMMEGEYQEASAFDWRGGAPPHLQGRADQTSGNQLSCRDSLDRRVDKLPQTTESVRRPGHFHALRRPPGGGGGMHGCAAKWCTEPTREVCVTLTLICTWAQQIFSRTHIII